MYLKLIIIDLYVKKKSLSKIYKSICNKIPDSIFVILGQSFFEDSVKSQIIDVYCIENKKKNSIHYYCN